MATNKLNIEISFDIDKQSLAEVMVMAKKAAEQIQKDFAKIKINTGAFEKVENSIKDIQNVRIDSNQFDDLKNAINSINTNKAESEIEDLGVAIGNSRLQHQKYADFIRSNWENAKQGFTLGIINLRNEFNSWSRALRFGQGWIRDISRTIVNSTESFRQFEQGLANVGSLLGKSANELQDYSEQLINAGIAAGDIQGTTKAAYQAVSLLGEQALQTGGFMESMAKASVAGLADMDDAVNLTAAFIKGMGLDIQDSEMILDQAFQTVNLGATTFAELAKNAQKVTSTAKAVGLQIQDVNTVFATLTGTTGNTNRVATQLAAILRGISAPSKSVQKEAKKLGIEFSVAAVQTKGFAGFLEDLKNKTNGEIEVVNKLFKSQNARTAITALLNDQYENFGKNLEAITNSQGAMQKAFDVNSMSMEQRIKVLTATWQALQIEVVGRVAPAIVFLLESVRQAINWFRMASKETDIFKNATLLLTQSLNIINSSIGNFQDIFKNYSNILEIAAVSIATLTLAIKINTLENIKYATSNISTVIPSIWAKVTATTAATAANIKESISIIGLIARENGLIAANQAVATSLNTVKLSAGSLIAVFAAVGFAYVKFIEYNKTFGSTLENVQLSATTTFMLIGESVKGLAKLWVNIWMGMLDITIGVFKDIWESAKNIFGNLGQLIASVLTFDVEGIKAGISGLFDSVSFENITQNAQSAFQNIENSAIQTGENIENILDIAAEITVEFGEAEGAVLTGITDEEKAKSKLKSQMENITEGLQANIPVDIDTTNISESISQAQQSWETFRQSLSQTPELDAIKIKFDEQKNNLAELLKVGAIDTTKYKAGITELNNWRLTQEKDINAKIESERQKEIQNTTEQAFQAAQSILGSRINYYDEIGQKDAEYWQLRRQQIIDNLTQEENLSEIQKEKLLQIRLLQLDAEREALQENQLVNQLVQEGLVENYESFVNSLVDLEMTGAERRKLILDNLQNAFLSFISKNTIEFGKQLILQENLEKQSAARKIAIQIATGAKQLAILTANSIKVIAVRMKEIAAGVASAYAALGPFAIPAIIGTVGGIIALIKSFSKGFAEGGYTGGSALPKDQTGEKPAGIVHEKEYVFEKNITMGNIQGLNELRSMMQKGIKLNDILASYKIESVSNYATGGFVGNQLGSTGNDLSPLIAAITAMETRNFVIDGTGDTEISQMDFDERVNAAITNLSQQRIIQDIRQ